MQPHRRPGVGEFMVWRTGLALLAYLAVAGYFLWTEHRVHVVGALSWLPWLLVLACPLLHLFMHGGHGGHGGHDADPSGKGKDGER